MDRFTINRAALGATASLGDLYDARCDDFCGLNIFQQSIPASAKTLIDSNLSDIHLVHSDNYSEKFSRMDVSAELQASLLAGLFDLSGSGRYLADKKHSLRTLKASLIYSIQTKNESVNIYNQELKDTFSIDAINSNMATHVVVGINWGANSVVSCTYENTDNRDVKEISGKLSVHLKSFCLSISGKAKVDITEGDKDNGFQFDVRMYGDVLPQNEELPTTFQGALAFIKKLPSLVGSSNQGKGKPIGFKLLPISVIRDYLKVNLAAHCFLVKLQTSSLLRVVQLFDEITWTQQKLNDFFQDVQDYDFCINDQILKDIRTFKNEIIIQNSSVRAQFCSLLVNIRSGKEDTAELEKLIQNVYQSSLSADSLQSRLEGWAEISKIVAFAKTLKSAGIKFLGKNENLDDTLLEQRDASIFVFFYSYTLRTEIPDIWRKNTQRFLAAAENQKNKSAMYFAVDYDIHPLNKPEKHLIAVKVFEKGQCVNEDLFGGKLDLEPLILPTKIDWIPDQTCNTDLDKYKYAVLAGSDANGDPVYVCRGKVFMGTENVIPGSLTMYRNGKKACFPLGGHHTRDDYEILQCPLWGVEWRKASGNTPHKNAIVAGHESGKKLYIARYFNLGVVHVGKFCSSELSHPAVYYCNGEKELGIETWKCEVLVRNSVTVGFLCFFIVVSS